jgi:hypothetical protein
MHAGCDCGLRYYSVLVALPPVSRGGEGRGGEGGCHLQCLGALFSSILFPPIPDLKPQRRKGRESPLPLGAPFPPAGLLAPFVLGCYPPSLPCKPSSRAHPLSLSAAIPPSFFIILIAKSFFFKTVACTVSSLEKSSGGVLGVEGLCRQAPEVRLPHCNSTRHSDFSTFLRLFLALASSKAARCLADCKEWGC